MDTRSNIYLLLDYHEYYGIEKQLSDAEKLISQIPSATLLNYIAGFEVNNYLNENSDVTAERQFQFINSLLSKTDDETRQQWVMVIKRMKANGHAPIFTWSYSNLLFYDLIFKNFNSLPMRDLTSQEAKNLFDAYLIVNGDANDKITLTQEEIQNAAAENRIESVIMPAFIYQRDYASTTDFSNQITRGMALFPYLETHSKYGPLMPDYYSSKNISGYLRMFKNLSVIFTCLGVENTWRTQLINLEPYFIAKEIDMDFIDTLCINSFIETYKEDGSFTLLRKRMLFKLDKFQFLVLSVNFLIDQFYKAQIFDINNFFKDKKIDSEFLSTKAKEFAEPIYLKAIVDECFPSFQKRYGDTALKANGDELCDVYLRSRNRIALIEFKDVLLSSPIKNSGDAPKFFAELEKKFQENQKGSPKGIRQLLNALDEIEANGIAFDSDLPHQKLDMYPIILYTDFSFGVEGLNKIFKKKFDDAISKKSYTKFNLRPLTFINLSFFEVHSDYLKNTNILDFFYMLDGYFHHTGLQNNDLASFEVFSRGYMNDFVKEELGNPSFFSKQLNKIVSA